jgi:tetratricopeptide (TPR) repeat protein
MPFPDDQDVGAADLASDHDLVESENDTVKTLDSPAPKASTKEIVEQIKKAARQGQKEKAYELSRELTKLAPDNIEAWLYCAVLTHNQEQAFVYLGQALSLAPEHTRARRGMYEMLKYYMENDPFLRYLEESGATYRVLTAESGTIIVPKDRESVTPYLSEKPTPLQPVFRWLRYAILGLPLAGLPTLVCASVAWGFACRAIYQTIDTYQLRRAEVALMYASILWIMSLFLSFLFVLHL